MKKNFGSSELEIIKRTTATTKKCTKTHNLGNIFLRHKIPDTPEVNKRHLT